MHLDGWMDGLGWVGKQEKKQNVIEEQKEMPESKSWMKDKRMDRYEKEKK